MARGLVLPIAVQQVAITLYQEGQSLRQIGERLGVSHESVRLWLKKNNIEREPPCTHKEKWRTKK